MSRLHARNSYPEKHKDQYIPCGNGVYRLNYQAA